MSSDSTDRLRALSPREDGSGGVDLDMAAVWQTRLTKTRGAGQRVQLSPRDREALLGDAPPGYATLASIAHPRSALQALLLSETLPVTVLRRSLLAAYLAARHAGDERRASLALEAARVVDARRAALISRLLDDFAHNYPDLDEAVVAVVEGGATPGDPEYQGVFGDIDFTVFTRDEHGLPARVSDALATSFAWSGFPVSPHGHNPTLDVHVFVQAAGPCSGDVLAAASPARQQAAGSRNPERFVTDAGLRWITNQMFFGGRPLRGLVERACQPVSIAAHEAPALASDVRCHLGARLMRRAADPVDAAHPSAAGRQQLAAALEGAKHVLRLVDARIIADPLGNALYHDRFVGPRHRTRGTSYHARIAADATRLLDAGRCAPLTEADRELLHDLTQLKLRGRYPTPWDYLGFDAAGWDRARRLVEAMRGLAQRLLAGFGLPS